MPSLTQDLALLDLVSQAKTTAGAAHLHERAHQLATTHQVASPVEVDSALAHLGLAHHAYDWDRPATHAERQARQIERQQHQADLKAQQPRLRWYHHVDGDTGLVLGFLLGFITGILLVPLCISDAISTACALALGVLLPLLMLLGCGWGFSALHERGEAHQAPVQIYQARREEEEEREQPITPTVGQGERWLTFDEVAAQARLWMNSEVGLMVEDARRLDARAAELAKTIQEEHERAVLDRLQSGPMRASAPAEGLST